MNNRLTNENIDNVLKYLPYFESTDKEFYKIDKEYLMDPYIYDKEVNYFIKALYEENIVFSLTDQVGKIRLKNILVIQNF